MARTAGRSCEVQSTGECVRLYCECGRPVRAGVQYHGERVGTLVFFDDELSSTCGERLTHCPGCSKQLKLLMLRGSPATISARESTSPRSASTARN
jgi:hypothetical protein